MKERKYKNDYLETDRKTRVKMYKSGKHWVSMLMSRIGLTKIFKGKTDKSSIKPELISENSVKQDDESEILDSKTEKVIKGAAAAGTLAGGFFLLKI